MNELEKMGAPLVITSGTDYLSIQESIALALNDVTHKKNQAQSFKSRIMLEFGQDAILKKWEKALGL